MSIKSILQTTRLEYQQTTLRWNSEQANVCACDCQVKCRNGIITQKSWTWLRNDREKERGGLDLCFGFGAARPAWLPRNLSQSGGHKIYTVGRGIGAEAGANEP